MAFVILVLSACAATVFVTLGSWSRLVRTPLQSRWILVPVIAIPVALAFVDIPANRIGTLGFGLYLGAYGLLLVFCLLNLSVRGVAVVAMGVALNTLVIGLNHGMPTTAVDGASVATTAMHKPRESSDLLPWLGDVIVMPVTRETISFGDLIIGVGLVNVVFWASRPRKRHAEDGPTIDISQYVPPADDIDTMLGSGAPATIDLADTGELAALGDSTATLPAIDTDIEPDPRP